MKLKDKICIVTGAASGIGKRIAERFAEEGGKVAITDVDLDGAEQLAKEISEDRALGVKMDVTNETSVNQAVDKVRTHFGGIDVLVSNAGIQLVDWLEEFSFDDWHKVLSVHLDGAFLTSKAVLPHMYRQESGSIIFMGSVHSKEASERKAPYITAKHGLLGLARLIAKEGGSRGVRANTICPGFVKTPLVEKQIPKQAEELNLSEDEVINKIMLNETVDSRFTTVDEVAEIALLFAAFPSMALTGQSLLVSHGWHMD